MALLTAFNIGILLILFLIYKLWLIWKQMRNLPPGPFSLPFIGSLCVYMDKKVPLPQYIDNLTKEYGDIMTVWLGAKPTVILSSMEAVKAAFIDNQHDFASRPDSILFDLLNRGHGGIFGEKYNLQWKAHKKLAARAIRRIVETQLLEEIVQNGLKESLADLEAKENQPIDLSNYLSNVVFNVILNFCFGERYRLNDPEFLRLVNLSLEANHYWDRAQYIDKVPYVQYLPSTIVNRFPRIDNVLKIIEDYYVLIGSKVKEHEITYNPENIRDILDSLYEQKDLLNFEGQHVQRESFSRIIFEIFSAGTDTTSYTLMWHFLYMVKYPEVQEKCYEEIKRVIGIRAPKLNDKQNMPYVEASILETLRLRPFVPLNAAHSCDSDKQLMGYTIPKGADININTLALHKDPKIWSNPDNYDPNNFLKPDGTVFRPPNFFTFGAGRRACLGENLAKNDLFLITVGFLQKFRFQPILEANYSDVQNPLAELFFIPQPYDVVPKLRI